MSSPSETKPEVESSPESKRDSERAPIGNAELWWAARPALIGVGLLVLFDAIGRTYFGRYDLELGTFRLPEPREAVMWLAAACFGIPAAAALAIALMRAARLWPDVESVLTLLPGSEDKVWIAFGALAALLVPFAIRMLLLDDAPIADDESAYQFGAELVASGHFTTASPPMKLFYDRSFMINDGHLYPMYFMGWPILMAPGVWVGAAGYMNAIYSGATVPAIYLAGRELGGRSVARAALLLFVTSPMFAIAAATQMSNTTCLMALAWTFACWLRSRRDGAALRWHAGVGVFFGLATLIRPMSTIGIGGPILIAWLVEVVRGPRAALPSRLLAVGVPGALALALFLAINKIQNGSYTTLSYAREFEYAKENGLRFTNWGVPHYRAQLAAGTLKPHFSGRPLWDSLANAAAAILRLGTATFGWVPCFFFVPFGVKRKAVGAIVLVLGILAHFVVHFGVRDLGIDAFGTHHYFEVGLGMVLLTAMGASAIARWLADHLPSLALLPGALLAALTVLSITSTTPPRMRALYYMGVDVNFARDVLAREHVKRAVVFSPQPFTSRIARCTTGTRHFVYWRPNNDPELKNDILWVNHVTVEDDRKFLEQFPDRIGIVYFFDDSCAARFVKIDSPGANAIPPGNIDNLLPPPGLHINGP